MSFAAAAALQGISQIGSAMLTQYYNKKNMRDQAALEYAYAQRYAENSPAWNVKGLRAAGLNPILAVSNGVNLGANIPNVTNSSPKVDIDLPAVEALKAAKETDIGQQNADSTSDMADAQESTAEANMLRAKAEASLKQAQAAKVIQDTKFDKEGGGFKNPVVNDLVRAANKGFESVEEYQNSLRQPRPFGDIPKSNPYIENSPKLDERDSRTFDILKKEYGSSAARELFKPAKDLYEKTKQSRTRALFVR